MARSCPELTSISPSFCCYFPIAEESSARTTMQTKTNRVIQSSHGQTHGEHGMTLCPRALAEKSACQVLCGFLQVVVLCNADFTFHISLRKRRPVLSSLFRAAVIATWLCLGLVKKLKYPFGECVLLRCWLNSRIGFQSSWFWVGACRLCFGRCFSRKTFQCFGRVGGVSRPGWLECGPKPSLLVTFWIPLNLFVPGAWFHTAFVVLVFLTAQVWRLARHGPIVKATPGLVNAWSRFGALARVILGSREKNQQTTKQINRIFSGLSWDVLRNLLCVSSSPPGMGPTNT